MKFKITTFEMIPFLLLMGMIATVPVAAQQTLPAPPAPVAAVTVTPGYQYSAGDVLSVSVVNFPTLSAPQTMVTPDGTISVPLLDQVSVKGLTQDQVTKLLIGKWKKFVYNPAVTVALVQKHAQTVVLNGYLNRTGTIDYRPGLHLLDALAQMGGSLPTADPSNAVLTHADGSKQTIDLSHPEKKSDDADVNVVLQPDDVLYIPEQQGKISVVGEVKQPGNLSYKENLNVLDAISSCGGINEDTADLNNSTLTHNGVTKKIDLYALLKNGDLHENTILSSGDILSIPELHNRVYVYGDVGRPGFYYYKPGDRLTDAFSNASVAPDADLNKVNLIHVTSDKKVATLVKVNLNDYLLRGKVIGNPEVQPGDAVYVPKQAHSFKLEDIFTPLQAVGTFSYTTRLLQGH